MLVQFLNEKFVVADGQSTPYREFVEAFHRYLFDNGVCPTEWPEKKIKAALQAEKFVIGTGPEGLLIVGNLLNPRTSKKRWVKHPSDKYRLTLDRK
ncbi:MAG TPA: hypothetical protein VMJ32_12850 [Pirellulales bacterium]|nr:hypothetical protein [Pirellulales bacterium]